MKSRIIRVDPPVTFGGSGKYYFNHPSYLEAILNAFVTDYETVPLLEDLLIEVSRRKSTDIRDRVLVYQERELERWTDLGLWKILIPIARGFDKSRADLVDLMTNLSSNPNTKLRLPCIRILLREIRKSPDFLAEWLSKLVEGADVDAKIAVLGSLFENNMFSSKFVDIYNRLSIDDDDRVKLMFAFSIYILFNIPKNDTNGVWQKIERLSRDIQRESHEFWSLIKDHKLSVSSGLLELFSLYLRSRTLGARQRAQEYRELVDKWKQRRDEREKMRVQKEDLKLSSDTLEVFKESIRNLLCSKNEEVKQIVSFSLVACHKKFPKMRNSVEKLWFEFSFDPKSEVREAVLYCIRQDLANVPEELKSLAHRLQKDFQRRYIV